MAWWLSVGASESQNPVGNTSTVSATVYLNWNNGQAYAGYNFGGTVYIGDAGYPYTAPTSANWPNQVSSGSVAMASFSRTYEHSPSGYRGGVGTSADLGGPGGYAPGYLSAGGPSFGAIDYTRIPSAPSYVSASNVGPVITVSWPDAATPFGPLTYYWAYRSSTNGGATWGNWSGDNNVGTAKTFTQTFTGGATYQFRVRAANSDGTSGWMESNTLFLSSGGKRFTGSNWALTVGAAKRFNGSSWVDLVTGKRFDGTNWVNLT